MNAINIDKCWQEFRVKYIGEPLNPITGPLYKATYFAGFVKCLELTQGLTQSERVGLMIQAFKEMQEEQAKLEKQ